MIVKWEYENPPQPTALPGMGKAVYAAAPQHIWSKLLTSLFFTLLDLDNFIESYFIVFSKSWTRIIYKAITSCYKQDKSYFLRLIGNHNSPWITCALSSSNSNTRRLMSETRHESLLSNWRWNQSTSCCHKLYAHRFGLPSRPSCLSRTSLRQYCPNSGIFSLEKCPYGRIGYSHTIPLTLLGSASRSNHYCFCLGGTRTLHWFWESVCDP